MLENLKKCPRWIQSYSSIIFKMWGGYAGRFHSRNGHIMNLVLKRPIIGWSRHVVETIWSTRIKWVNMCLGPRKTMFWSSKRRLNVVQDWENKTLYPHYSLTMLHQKDLGPFVRVQQVPALNMQDTCVHDGNQIATDPLKIAKVFLKCFWLDRTHLALE